MMVERDYARLGPMVRDFWRPLEEETCAAVDVEIEQLKAAAAQGLDLAKRRERLTSVMRGAWARASDLLGELSSELNGEHSG